MINKKTLQLIALVCLVIFGAALIVSVFASAPGHVAPPVHHAVYAVALPDVPPQQDPTQIAATLGIGAALILTGLLGLWFVGRVRRDPNTSPTVQIILKALEGWAWKAIFAGESLGLKAFKDTSQSIEGADKAKIAASTYGLLPERITIGLSSFSPREFITLEQWRSFIEGTFQQADAFVLSNEAYLKKQVDALRGGAAG